MRGGEGGPAPLVKHRAPHLVDPPQGIRSGIVLGIRLGLGLGLVLGLGVF